MVQKRLFPKTRSAVTEKGTTVAGTTQSPKESFSFYKSKIQLRETHKRLRAGLLVWENVPKETQELLMRYYGYDKNGVQM